MSPALRRSAALASYLLWTAPTCFAAELETHIATSSTEVEDRSAQQDTESASDELTSFPVATRPTTFPAPPRVHMLDAVLVTAQKREENLQEVPISIQAFSGEDLVERGIETTQQLGLVVPSLQFTSVAGFPIVFIRGIGTDNFVASAEPSIATYIDGIYTPNGESAFNSLINVKSVEVLKGPQGTLFGRNATGGAISVTTEEPGRKFKASFAGTLGNFDSRAASLNASGPITDWLSVGASGELSRKDAFYSDLFYDTQPDRLEAARFKVHFHPTNKLSLSLTHYLSSQQGLRLNLFKNLDPSPLGALLGIRAQEDDYIGESDYPASTKARQRTSYGTLSWKLPQINLKLLASDQHMVSPQSSTDFDASRQPLAALSTTNTFIDLQTGELQILSTSNTWGAERFSWVAGLYYLRSNGGSDPGFLQLAPGAVSGLLNAAQLPGFGEIGDRLQELFNAFGLDNTPLGDGGLRLEFRGLLGTRSYSAYAQGTLKLTDWLDLTLGGRAQREKRFLSKSETHLSDFGGSGSTTLLSFDLQGATASNFSPKAVLGLKPFAGALIYASYAVAYKSGTYNIVNIYVPPTYIVPEQVTAYELGAKFDLLDRRLRLNAALFDSEIDNMQSGFVSLLSGGAVRFVTVPHARSRGAEIGATWLPFAEWNPGLALVGSGAWIDAIYTDFPNGAGYRPESGLYSGRLDHSGNRIVFTPEFSGNLGIVQTIESPHGSLEFAVDEYYNSGFHPDPQNSVTEPAYAILNARVGYLYKPWKARLTLFGRNLLDKRYHAITGRNDFGVAKALAAPREYGVRLNWDF